MLDRKLLKKSWYDGFIFEKFISPNQRSLFEEIKKIIHLNSSVLDVGCATVDLLFYIQDKIRIGIGIDISPANIRYAKKKLNENLKNKIKFIDDDLSNIEFENKFDYCIFSYILHEISYQKRIEFIDKAIKLSRKIIIADYSVFSPNKIWKTLEKTTEFLAGKQHYSNYKNYIRNNGIAGTLSKFNNKLKIDREILNYPRTTHIVELSIQNYE